MGEFATADDVATSLGRALTDAEESTATDAIETVTGLIVDCVDRDLDWAGALEPVPAALKGLCVAKAKAAVVNPGGVASEAETLGAHSSSRTFQRSSDVGVFLSPFEERVISRAVYGTTSGSSSPASIVDTVVEMADGAEPE